MNLDRFSDICKSSWDAYLRELESNLRTEYRHKVFYPTHLVTADFGHALGMELLGVSGKRAPLKLSKIRKIRDTEYFDSFDKKDNEIGNATNLGMIQGLCFAREPGVEQAKLRFPYVSRYDKLLRYTDCSLMSIERNNLDVTAMADCAFIGSNSLYSRCKHILFFLAARKNISNHELVQGILKYQIPSKSYGFTFANKPKLQNELVTASLQNLFLSGSTKETFIDSYLQTHPQILKSVFGSDKIIYNSTLDWVVHDGTVEERSIKPDMFIQRKDGYFDIGDFKTALLTKKSLTSGKRKKRKYSDPVSSGIAQLVNYAWYFSFKKNADFAERKYGIKVSNPKFYLLIGNQENTDPEKMNQAARSALSNVTIIDYDTVARWYLKND